MNCSIYITTEMKSRDAIASSAYHCLTQDLGYGSHLMSLQRKECWSIALDLPEVSARLALGQDLALNTKLFVNPNKHFHSVLTELPISSARPANGPSLVHVLVSEREDGAGKAAFSQLKNLYQINARIQSVSFGFLWTLKIHPDVAAPVEFAEAITRVTDRTHGLLCNPHSQTYKVCC